MRKLNLIAVFSKNLDNIFKHIAGRVNAKVKEKKRWRGNKND